MDGSHAIEANRLSEAAREALRRVLERATERHGWDHVEASLEQFGITKAIYDAVVLRGEPAEAEVIKVLQEIAASDIADDPTTIDFGDPHQAVPEHLAVEPGALHRPSEAPSEACNQKETPPVTEETFGHGRGNCPEAGSEHAAAGDGVQIADFWAYMPMHNYIFAPTGDFWPAASVNARIPPLPLRDKSGNQVTDDHGKPKFMSAAAWLDQNQPIEQMTWVPGQPPIIRDRLVKDGGWIERPGVAVFNQYHPPIVEPGDPALAIRWVEHVRLVYPDDADHIIRWLAQRVQRPGEKINHALVLGGSMGIGKDTLLEPVKYAVGDWNFAEVEANQLLGRFNGFIKSVVLRVSEARDHGEFDRYAFYDRTKTLIAAPPNVLRVDEKHIREHPVVNVVAVILTTNHKTGGIYLSPNDRRHYVAWSDLDKADFSDEYWKSLWDWYADGGLRHVAAYLAQLDISAFNPKASPPQTEAFWAIVNSGRSTASAELADALDKLRNPDAVTVADVAFHADDDLGVWLRDRKNSRVIPHRFEECGYEAVRNPDAKDGLWKVGGKRAVIYVKRDLAQRDRIDAARKR